MEDRKILTGKCLWVIRKCRICEIESKILQSHMAQEHPRSVWWGVLGDQTCWRCQNYCTGTWIEFLIEDFGVGNPNGLIDRVKGLGLHFKSISAFSDKEIYFLHELDTIYFLPQKPISHSPLWVHIGAGSWSRGFVSQIFLRLIFSETSISQGQKPKKSAYKVFRQIFYSSLKLRLSKFQRTTQNMTFI